MKTPIKTIFQANTGGYSSKRVFGALGFLTVIGITIACTVMSTQAPTIAIDLIYASVALLGVDSVTGIWKTRARNIDKKTEIITENNIENDEINSETSAEE